MGGSSFVEKVGVKNDSAAPKHNYNNWINCVNATTS